MKEAFHALSYWLIQCAPYYSVVVLFGIALKGCT